MRDVADEEAQTLLRALAATTGDPAWCSLATPAEERIDHRQGRPSWQARLVGASEVLAVVSGRVGRPVVVDPIDVINQRAALRGLTPRGDISAGGGCRLLPTQSGWVAISLNRAADWELLPALFGTARTRWDWTAVASATAQTVATELESAGAELGLAIAVVPETAPPVAQPWRLTMSPGRQLKTVSVRRVLDLSALWAGPLCSSLLRRAGADVTTVESTSRPDGARRGDPDLHRLLHDGNTFVALDFGDQSGRAELQRLVNEADVVVTSARIRALQQLGLDPFAAVEQRRGLTWVGISAYGLTGAASNRIGYGDDTAVAGGLVNREPAPAFLGDALADPITGIYAAIAALAVSASGGGVVDVALRDVAAHVARGPR